jgi:transcriptional regulator
MKTRKEIDLGLDVILAVSRPGQRWPTRDIAYVCGCTNTNIFIIEKRALKKIRERMRRKLELSHGQLAVASMETL